ncbi:Glycosyl transferase family 2 [Filimonas lacunae]|uniref:Glycosyl transferase family 2 n=1 Tax=Filimonas lacunae TaxID=477680 RepID=A0A173MRU4_9BACT|nr:glycosyltransferase [Filimonas lacunae]BAV10236.1 hypothetical protein FLA_6297 [Filimonas lacunae]SIT17962.1 Glycosyl transferase family 2 [Filimonas lacunae]
MSAPVFYEKVTLLITHYNRSASLARLLKAFAELNCRFGEIIVSDDGSKPEHLDVIKSLQNSYTFTLLTVPKNKGLGNNNNKGHDAVKTPYTLYVQEDFVPKPVFPAHFSDALAFMEEDESIDIARFYAYQLFPYLTPYKKGFDLMRFKIWYPGHMKFFSYSDHPHLKRRNFLEKFGRYRENCNSDVTEHSMCISFVKNKGKGIYYRDFTSLFDQMNSSDEPSTAAFRTQWQNKKTLPVLFLRQLYLQYKTAKLTKEYIAHK